MNFSQTPFIKLVMFNLVTESLDNAKIPLSELKLLS